MGDNIAHPTLISKMLRRSIAIVLVFSFLMTACQPKEKTPVVVFAAGSLIIPFDALEKAYESIHPEIDLQMEYHGSIQVMRHCTELHEPIDVIATADTNLIPMLMYQTLNPDTGSPYADWYIRFASNRLALAYTGKSRFSDTIDQDKWFEVLTNPEVRVGIADPRFDASGYRALMVFNLAERLQGSTELFNQMFGDQFTFDLYESDEDGISTIHVPEVLETRQGSHIILRGASIQLLALLESGDLDYAFEYESVIRQHGLKMLAFPDALNLGSADHIVDYNRVQVKLDFQRFKSVEPRFIGDQISYGITIPSNAPHPDEAADFIAFLLGAEGQEIMKENFHPLLDPLQVDGYENLPASLKELFPTSDQP